LYPESGQGRNASSHRPLTRTFPLSSKAPYLPSIGPAQKWVPRTARAAFGVLTTILFLRIPSIWPPAKRNAPRVALRTTLAELLGIPRPDLALNSYFGVTTTIAEHDDRPSRR
jgi:hypothetical protein